MSFPLKIYLIALIIRLIPVLVAYSLPIGLDDMFQYDMLGRNLAEGNGFRWYSADELAMFQNLMPVDFVLPADYAESGVLTTFRAPAYPYFLAGVYSIVGGQWRFLAARIAQSFVGALMAPLTFWLAGYLIPEKEKVAKGAGWVLAVYPMLVVFQIALATENLFIPLMLASVVLLFYASEKDDLRYFALAGLVLGLAVLTRSIIIAALPFMMLWLWFVTKQRWAAVVVPVVLALTIAPWSIRSTKLAGKFTLVENSMGYNLHMGYHPDSTGTFTFGVSLELLPYIDDLERDRVGTQMAIDFIKAGPGRVPELIVRKLGHFFALETRPIVYFYSNNLLGYIPLPLLIILFLIIGAPFVVLSILSVIGAVQAPPNKYGALIGMISFAYLMPHILIMSEPRFHLALVPFFAVYGVYGWQQRKQLGHSLNWQKVTAGLLISLLVLNWALQINTDRDKWAQIFSPTGNTSHFDY